MLFRSPLSPNFCLRGSLPVPSCLLPSSWARGLAGEGGEKRETEEDQGLESRGKVALDLSIWNQQCLKEAKTVKTDTKLKRKHNKGESTQREAVCLRLKGGRNTYSKRNAGVLSEKQAGKR